MLLVGFPFVAVQGASCDMFRLLQVSRLLASTTFQRYSGPVLEQVVMEQEGISCFEFAAQPETFPVTWHHNEHLCFIRLVSSFAGPIHGCTGMHTCTYILSRSCSAA